jgi:hypothetical protein
VIRVAACCVALSALVACSSASLDTNRPDAATQQMARPASSGSAEAAEGLRVHDEVFGEGEPIVVMAGAFGDSHSMQQVIGPRARERQVIAIDLEGHGRTALRRTPMTHERNGDDVAAVLRHLKIAHAGLANHSCRARASRSFRATRTTTSGKVQTSLA